MVYIVMYSLLPVSFIDPVYLVYCRIQSGTSLFVILDCW